jgi:hypothetical protein
MVASQIAENHFCSTFTLLVSCSVVTRHLNSGFLFVGLKMTVLQDPFRPITAPKYSPQPATKLPRLEAEIEEMRRQQKKAREFCSYYFSGVISEIMQLGYPPDTKTYADLIWSCSKENQIELAMQLFQYEPRTCLSCVCVRAWVRSDATRQGK